MIAQKIEIQTISKYCEECLKFRQKKCDGKTISKGIPHRGRIVKQLGEHLGGLNFCKQYEFDERLYNFQDGSGEVETIKHVRQRQAKREVEISNQEHSDIVDIADSLSSADFEGLI